METPYRDLKLDQVRELIGDGYQVVDVRENWEWERGHIAGARHVVLASILARPDLHRFRERTIFSCDVRPSLPRWRSPRASRMSSTSEAA